MSINGRSPEWVRDRIPFKFLTPLFPQEKFKLSTRGGNISTRLMDLFAPYWQRPARHACVAAKDRERPHFSKGCGQCHCPQPSRGIVYLLILLIDERPEEVTDMKRSVNAEVIASTFDEPADRHVRIADLSFGKGQAHGGVRARRLHPARFHHPVGTSIQHRFPRVRVRS